MRLLHIHQLGLQLRMFAMTKEANVIQLYELPMHIIHMNNVYGWNN